MFDQKIIVERVYVVRAVNDRQNRYLCKEPFGQKVFLSNCHQMIIYHTMTEAVLDMHRVRAEVDCEIAVYEREISETCVAQ